MSTCCFKFKKLLGAFATCTVLAAGVYAPPAFASNVSDNSLFELDAGSNVPDTLDSNCSGGSCNTQPSPASALPDDWNDFGPNGTSTQTVKKGTSHADVATGIIVDDVERVFSQGSKDLDDVSSWAFRAGSSPPKADMTHAYAAGYSHDSGGNSIPLAIFFGSNRGSFNGTTELGYWFFKQTVTANDATGKFSGHHCDGDLLVTIAYDNGGKIGTMRVRKWSNPTSTPCDGNGTLVDVVNSTNNAGITGRFCDVSGTTFPTSASDKVCAGSNFQTITLPWAPNAGSPGQFLEGGIDVAALTGEAKPCFASFMATSRSSSTKKSETKNFILRDFPVCKLDVTKSCEFKEIAAANQARFTVTGVVTNSGGGTLTNITVTDDPALEANSLSFFDCTAKTAVVDPTLDPGGTVCYTATVLGAVGQQTNNDTITAHGSANGATIDSSGAPATCSATFNGFPTISKTCNSCLDDTTVPGKVILNTSYSGQLCNTNNFDFTNVTIKDLATGTDSAASIANIVIANGLINGSFTLGAGTILNPTCVSYTGTYLPHHALKKGSDPIVNTLNPDRAYFKDTISVTGTRPFGSADEALTNQPANCSLCINPDTPTARCGD